METNIISSQPETIAAAAAAENDISVMMRSSVVDVQSTAPSGVNHVDVGYTSAFAAVVSRRDAGIISSRSDSEDRGADISASVSYGSGRSTQTGDSWTIDASTTDNRRPVPQTDNIDDENRRYGRRVLVDMQSYIEAAVSAAAGSEIGDAGVSSDAPAANQRHPSVSSAEIYGGVDYVVVVPSSGVPDSRAAESSVYLAVRQHSHNYQQQQEDEQDGSFIYGEHQFQRQLLQQRETELPVTSADNDDRKADDSGSTAVRSRWFPLTTVQSSDDAYLHPLSDTPHPGSTTLSTSQLQSTANDERYLRASEAGSSQYQQQLQQQHAEVLSLDSAAINPSSSLLLATWPDYRHVQTTTTAVSVDHDSISSFNYFHPIVASPGNEAGCIGDSMSGHHAVIVVAPKQQQQQHAGAGGKRKRRRVITPDQRRAANVRERRRMSHLNDAFDALRKRVPTFAYEKKLSRIETLRLAVTYIQFMAELVTEIGDTATTMIGGGGPEMTSSIVVETCDRRTRLYGPPPTPGGSVTVSNCSAIGVDDCLDRRLRRGGDDGRECLASMRGGRRQFGAMADCSDDDPEESEVTDEDDDDEDGTMDDDEYADTDGLTNGSVVSEGVCYERGPAAVGAAMGQCGVAVERFEMNESMRLTSSVAYGQHVASNCLVMTRDSFNGGGLHAGVLQ